MSKATDLLYKYRAIDTRALNILGCKEFYCASPASLNDPLDCHVRVIDLLDLVIDKEKSKKRRALLSILRDTKVRNRETNKVELVHDTFRALPLRTGVLSLSRNPTDALMWSHYADGHKGMAIGITPAYVDDLRKEWRKYSLLGGNDVLYAKEPLAVFQKLWLSKLPHIKRIRETPTAQRAPLDAEFRESYIRDFLVTVLTTKLRSWKYEREYRVVRAVPGLLPFPATALKEIVFGLKTSEADKRTVRALLAGREWAHVRFRHTVTTPGRFELTLVNE